MGTTSWVAPWGFWVRTFLICGLTLVCEYQWATTGSLLMGVLVGILHAQIGLSVQHDASHGALSKSPAVNAFFSHGADWIGNSRFIWLQQHVLWHHPFTNHHDLDPDASSAEPLLVFSNYSSGLSKANSKKPTKPVLSYQDLITHLVLTAYGPSIVFNLPAILKMQHNEHVPTSIPSGEYMTKQKPTAVMFRLWYFLRIVLAPWLLAGTPLVAALFLVNFVTGVCLTFLFVVSHNFEGSDRDPLKLADSASSDSDQLVKGKDKLSKDKDAPVCWYKAQVETSCTYGGTTAMLLTGGLNLQIEHHLFPRLSSWHYPRIHEEVRQCCARHQVEYKYYPTLWDNTLSMLRYMREVGVMAVLAHAE
jgi:fatty acid desaturase (delta-4 desaturase)